MFVAVVLALVSAVTNDLSWARTLTVAVAPSDGTEPPPIPAYADALIKGGENIRLSILASDDSAAALQDGRTDWAAVRPDMSIPRNGLTLAIPRDQTMIIATPQQAASPSSRTSHASASASSPIATPTARC